MEYPNHVAGFGIIAPPPPLGWYRLNILVGIIFLAMVGIPPFLPSLFLEVGGNLFFEDSLGLFF